MIRQYELVERVREYAPDADENLLNRAYVFSMKMHGKQMRASGDPYFSHPLEVAGILTGMKMDSDTIITALLHDTIEDTIATHEQIEELFGTNVAKMVDGVTKLSKLTYSSESAKQADNFRKFLLAMSHDIRVLLVKLADRLHNMRTLHHIGKPEKRARISRETLDIYAPLAERIGMQAIKEELESLAFPHVYPEAYESITKRMDQLHANTADIKDKVISELERLLSEAGIEAEVFGREKQLYSIWRKMTYRHVALDDQADIVAFRIIVDDTATCYRALGVVHRKWQALPGLIKDYISMPKPNGYRSIHTAVLGPQKKRIEIQIRSSKMDAVAEQGVAAHWQYKQQSSDKEGEQYKWLKDLLEIMEHAESPDEFLEHTKLAMYQNQVFCFTPKGKLVNLPQGSTVVDFAYAVHTDVGDSCVGGKVNGNPVQLRTRLVNGDQVEILRSKAQQPSPNWLSFVVTGKAKAAIRRFISHKKKDEYQALGKKLLERAFKLEERDFNDKAIQICADKLKLHNIADIYELVGKGELADRKVLETIFPGIKVNSAHSLVPTKMLDTYKDLKGGDNSIPIRGLTPGLSVHMSECCHPILGDRIVGIVATGKGIMVHTIDCEALDAYSDAPEAWLDLSWTAVEEENTVFVSRIEVLLEHVPGALAAVLSVVAQEKGNISNIKFIERATELFRISLDIEVRDVKHLTSIVAALRVSDRVSSVERSFR
ncbi:RelA/SpoT family protein [Paremcibacter congregatus]|uniref:GTP pyrophosphokinase rsh n=1 Tax=Paremcibacter congregatus TaxID=2043170 RepID=A0A2G4YN98_9PROT|nr:bifunctional (p)ppGpp synthetase/guanosine-3',5'-bis(diphosphate) 3'-pyrophosphohydrolase [Paremcibacter congregatus]PHZ83809.1 bifunctional (p)ppGpp synthetase/guanosine-3',5'-bis(diphosphate) 3'-pyrophosphohydrolase [Paremcibacter congregatus]QDE27512.1 bifunctional (p)ppGpp synthetase/guanosine-3',5'-bis(diphosphate) 3'-pyrophosphohydrolase [Paremcibacter congregatus]